MANSHTLGPLQPQDVMSFIIGADPIHAKPPPNPNLNPERWPFHSEPPDHGDPKQHLLAVTLAVKLAYAIAPTS